MLSFVREFSSEADLTRSLHPKLDRALGIIAGPASHVEHQAVLNAPVGITTDSTNRVLISDQGATAIHIFDFAANKYSRIDGAETSRFQSPSGIAVDSADNIYFTDPKLQVVMVYDKQGKFKGQLGKLKGGESYFDMPTGIAIDHQTGRIYVCDTPRNMIVILDRDAKVLVTVGKRGGGFGPGEFKSPRDLAILGDELFVADQQNARVQVLDLAGHYRREVKIASEASAALDRGFRMTVDGDKNLYVTYLTDSNLARVVVMDASGRLLCKSDTPRKKGRPKLDMTVWANSGHCLYMLDSEKRNIQVFKIGQRTGNSEPCQ